MDIPTFVSALQAHGEAAAAKASDFSPTLVWLVPLLPVFGFLFQTFIGRKLPKPIIAFVSCATVLGSCVIAWVLFFQVKGTHQPVVADIGPWINIPGLKDGWLSVVARHRLVVDQLTAVMILVITNIGFLIHVYSTGYMAEEKRFARYFSYLNLFTGFMLILVMASNLLLMFVGWEGVGLCSYLLIGFWFEKSENAAAGMKAFVVNRVGDLAFTIGALILFVTVGKATGVWTVDFQELKKVIEGNPAILDGVTFIIPFLLFIGATGKSAQMPLYVWLPDAMAGPTPVSALIHAATMVTAGVYMIARMNFVYTLSPAAMAVVTGVGAFTAIFAGTIGIAQNDIKKVLAYSTVSQLGFMFMGVGVGAFAAGIFHLFTHAFFKACLFLGSGSVIHGMHHEQDIRKMGGLKARMPVTFWTFLIASLALSGVPPLAGFFSKDEILWKAWSTETFKDTGLGMWYGKLIWLTGACAAACTAFYMTRLVIKTFLDRPKWGGHAAAATAFSGAGLPDWMDEDDKKKKEPKKEPPKTGTGPDGMPAWMEEDPVLPQDESMLDLGTKFARKDKKEPAPTPPPPPPAPPRRTWRTSPIRPFPRRSRTTRRCSTWARSAASRSPTATRNTATRPTCPRTSRCSTWAGSARSTIRTITTRRTPTLPRRPTTPAMATTTRAMATPSMPMGSRTSRPRRCCSRWWCWRSGRSPSASSASRRRWAAAITSSTGWRRSWRARPMPRLPRTAGIITTIPWSTC